VITVVVLILASPKLVYGHGEGDALIRAHIVLDTMALPSGIYTIENVKYSTVTGRCFFGANEGDVVAGS
jgi:hypothetical protein